MSINKNIAIKVEHLSKIYRLGEIGTGTVSRDIERWFAKVRGKEDPFLRIGESNDRTQKGISDVVYSLKDVSFEIEQGTAVGIIGRNGAGKSTLLKLLSRVTAPTSGRIKLRGRIASLLEVGTGFHPELTGRENIYLNGAILGMRKKEIAGKFDEIVAFSGVERYIDTPVKRYSSGMYVRLAFAVAAHLESEILVVDEVLAVGDAEFQQKCLGKMGEVSRGEGRTVLFVSHNMGAVKNLCNVSMLLENGALNSFGATNEIIEHYLARAAGIDRYTNWDIDDRPGDDIVKLQFIQIVNAKRSISDSLHSDDFITVEISYHILQEVKDLRIVASILSFDGTQIFSTSDYRYQHASRIRKPGQYLSKFTIPANTLNISRYYVSVDIEIPMVKNIVSNQIVSFAVDELTYNELGITITGRPPGVIHPQYQWIIESVN